MSLAVARRTEWFHRHIPGMPRYVLAFLHLRQPASLTVASGGKGALGSVVQQCSALAGFKYVFRVIILLVMLVASINPGTAEW